MSVPHYVSDYKRFTDELVRTRPIDEAVSLAVGGGYHEIGPLLCQLVANAGLEEGGSIVDVGCGSLNGSAPSTIWASMSSLSSLATPPANVPPITASQQATTCIPAEDASADMVVAFSVFTHLFQEESYTYLLEARRILKLGALLFLFLEFYRHWSIFETMLTRNGSMRDPI